jgi:hypothetical protein
LELGLGARYLWLPGGDDDRPDVQFVAAQVIRGAGALRFGKNLTDLGSGLGAVIESRLQDLAGCIKPRAAVQ